MTETNVVTEPDPAAVEAAINDRDSCRATVYARLDAVA